MTADLLSKCSPFRIHLRHNRLVLWVLLAFILIPSFTLFCWHWNSAASPGKTANTSLGENSLLMTSSGHSQAGSWLNEFLKVSHIARLSGAILPDSGNVFRNLSNREMIAANGDPFLFAYLSGKSEGPLVIQNEGQGTRTLGIPNVTGVTSRSAYRDALTLLQTEVGGSFAAFRSKLFGTSSHNLTQASSSTPQEENPFSKALSSLAESNDATAKQETAPESRTETQQTEETPVTEEPTPNTAAGPVTRPYLVLRVDESGNLHAMPASQPHAGALETAELGTRDFSILPFGDTADFMGSIAVADFNGDGNPDVVYFTPFQGSLRFFYGSADGTFTEGLNINAGNVSRSFATGDFNNDGRMDLALSSPGSGLVTLLFADAQGSYSYRSYYFQQYWDYIAAADTTGSGILDLIGVNYSDNAAVLLSFNQADGSTSGRVFSYTPALNSSIFTSNGQSRNLNAVLLSANLSLNIDNRQNQLTNVLNVSAGSNVFVVVGDLFGDGRTIIGIAIPHP
jgi:hypothetical protein